jgi:hypothetical protein
MNQITGASVGALLMLAPLCATAADLVVWWDEGYYPEEHEAVREIIAAFEQGSGKQVELVQYPQAELPYKIVAALKAGGRPTSLSASILRNMTRNGRSRIGSWTSRTSSATSRTCSIRMHLLR